MGGATYMTDPQELEIHYQTFIEDLHNFLPDGILDVDLTLLNDLGLLSNETSSEEEQEDALSHSFYVIESSEKLTLFNQKFVIWIVPKMVEQSPTTYTLVALNEPKQPHLEMVFATSGVYNHSSLVLRILEKFLQQIEENEAEICKIKNL